jgi:PKD domain
MPRPILLAAIAALSSGATSIAQATIAPPNYANSEGNTSNAFPWNRGPNSMRIQFVHDSTTFTSQGTSGSIIIHRLRYRPDAGGVNESWGGGSWPNVRIDLATCPFDHLTPSPTFAQNRGADVVTVHQGPVVVTPGNGLGQGQPLPFYIDIPLARPFRYDPAQGDLLVDIQLDGTGWSGQSRVADHVSTPANNPRGSRIYSTAGAAATTGAIGINYAPVCEFGYAPGNVLFPSFVATPARGASPLVVQFTDTSISPSPGGATAWAWDFDNNGSIDSTQRNPTFTYNGCGDFTVSLRVTDATGQLTVTRPAAVRTDEFSVDFTVQPLGGNQFQLNATSSLPAGGWSWDVDANGTIESTQANPVLSLGNGCSRVIRLSAVRNCRSATLTRLALLSPATLATNLQAGTGTVAVTAAGCLFDVQVLAPDGITVCGLTTATYNAAGPFTALVHVTDGSYVGKAGAPDRWRLVGSGAGMMYGGSVSAPSLNEVVLTTPFYLPPGNYGLAVHHTVANDNAYIAYVQTSAGTFANNDLRIHPSPGTAPGLAQDGLFTNLNLSPRQWSGRLHYTRQSLSNLGGHGFLGAGCTGSSGVPRNTAGAPPRLGNPLIVTLSNLAQNLALYWWGFSSTNSSAGSLPIDLQALGAAGCLIHASLDASVLLTGSNGSATFVFPLPNNASLLGTQFFTQGLSLDPVANALGLVATDAAGFVIGQ